MPDGIGFALFPSTYAVCQTALPDLLGCIEDESVKKIIVILALLNFAASARAETLSPTLLVRSAKNNETKDKRYKIQTMSVDW